MVMDTKEIFEALKILNTPVVPKDKSEKHSDEEQLNVSLAANITQLSCYLKGTSIEPKISQLFHQTKGKHEVVVETAAGVGSVPAEPPQIDIRWEFVRCHLKLLLYLKNVIQANLANFKETKEENPAKRSEQKAPPLSPDALSFAQQKLVMTSLQFVACLGISPYLERGVGIPLQYRSQFSQMLQCTDPANVSNASERLWVCLSLLMECSNQASLGSLILTRHLNDLLAGFLQLIHKAKKRSAGVSILKKAVTGKCLSSASGSGDAKNVAGQSKVTASAVPSNSSLQFSKFQAQKGGDLASRAELELEKLIRRTYQPLLVKEVLVLQAGSVPPAAPNKQTSVAPLWLRHACGRLLSDCLMKTNGVLNVLQAILEASTDAKVGDKVAFDWKKCDAAARIISKSPTTTSTTYRESYFSVVMPQILALLEAELTNVFGHQVRRVAVTSAGILLTKHRELAEKFLIQPLVEPLFKCTEGDVPKVDQPVVFCTETEIGNCITRLYQVMVVYGDPNSPLMNYLEALLHPVFAMYSFTRSGVSILRKPLEELLLKTLNYADCATAVSYLNFLSVGDQPVCRILPMMHQDLAVVSGSDGGVALVLTPGECEPCLDKFETTASAILELVKKIKEEEKVADFFLSCLMILTAIVSDEVDETADPQELPNYNQTTLLELTQMTEAEKLERNLTALSILAGMCDSLGPACLKNATHVIAFAKATLERCSKVVENTSDAVFGLFEGQTVTMAMGLLVALLTGEMQMNDRDFTQSLELLPLLQKVADNHPDLSIQQMATHLRTAIATRGHVGMEFLGGQGMTSMEQPSQQYSCNNATKQPNPQLDETKDVKLQTVSEIQEVNGLPDKVELGSPPRKPLIEEIPAATEDKKIISNSCTTENGTQSTDSNHLSTTPPDNQSTEEDQENLANNSKAISTFAEALLQLKEPLVPVKGHALILIKRLIEQQDPATCKDKHLILKIFLDHLSHSDSYIYLAAVQGLSVLAERDPDTVLPVLIRQFSNTGEDNADDQSKGRPAELRLKMGEVLVKTCRMLGDMAPKYRDILLMGFLNCATDPDPHIRASSLANLGEICKLLRFSLGNHIQQLFECIGALIKTDPAVEVRRAAAMFVTLLLEGLGTDSLKVLDENLLRLYRLLKHVAIVDTDIVVQRHIDAALGELKTVMNCILFPEQRLEKKIHVISAP